MPEQKASEGQHMPVQTTAGAAPSDTERPAWAPDTKIPGKEGEILQLSSFHSVSLFDRQARSKQISQVWPTEAGCTSASVP